MMINRETVNTTREPSFLPGPNIYNIFRNNDVDRITHGGGTIWHTLQTSIQYTVYSEVVGIFSMLRGDDDQYGIERSHQKESENSKRS